MRLIDADTAQPGLTIVSEEQTLGKGQRGRKWIDSNGQSLLMSLVLTPERDIEQQFAYNVLISLAIADYLQELYENWDIRIKWPNDIIINDKKAGGILIENVIRGNNWAYCIAGIGINVMQERMPDELPYATSLYMESGKLLSILDLVTALRERIFSYLAKDVSSSDMLEYYNQVLYRKDMPQRFKLANDEFTATVYRATPNGMLQLQHANGDIVNYTHGTLEWYWS